eukprot:PRCOL_00001125-RA
MCAPGPTLGPNNAFPQLYQKRLARGGGEGGGSVAWLAAASRVRLPPPRQASEELYARTVIAQAEGCRFPPAACARVGGSPPSARASRALFGLVREIKACAEARCGYRNGAVDARGHAHTRGHVSGARHCWYADARSPRPSTRIRAGNCPHWRCVSSTMGCRWPSWRLATALHGARWRTQPLKASGSLTQSAPLPERHTTAYGCICG